MLGECEMVDIIYLDFNLVMRKKFIADNLIKFILDEIISIWI
jgi:hypothetical protein